MPNQPTILVKKADGTTVRMTLDEVKKMKAGKKSETVPETVAEKAAEILKIPELEPAPVELLLMSDELHLLHEEVQPHEVSRPELVAAVSYDDTVAHVLKNAQLTPTPELQSRFQSLIMSLVKGVRTLAQVMEYAQAPVVKGGLALSATEAERFSMALKSTPGLPMVVPNSRVTIQEKEASSVQKNSLSTLKPNPGRAGNVPMHDVEAPAMSTKVIMGPIEEMKNFSLVDWRRLAATPDKAKEIILGKFTGWKEESFFLYRDTRLAWLDSPLVHGYQEKLIEAINKNTRLSDMATGFAAKNTLTPADITALVEVNRILAV